MSEGTIDHQLRVSFEAAAVSFPLSMLSNVDANPYHDVSFDADREWRVAEVVPMNLHGLIRFLTSSHSSFVTPCRQYIPDVIASVTNVEVTSAQSALEPQRLVNPASKPKFHQRYHNQLCFKQDDLRLVLETIQGCGSEIKSLNIIKLIKKLHSSRAEVRKVGLTDINCLLNKHGFVVKSLRLLDSKNAHSTFNRLAVTKLTAVAIPAASDIKIEKEVVDKKEKPEMTLKEKQALFDKNTQEIQQRLYSERPDNFDVDVYYSGFKELYLKTAKLKEELSKSDSNCDKQDE